MTLAQISLFHTAALQRKLAERAEFIYDVSVAFHAKAEDKMKLIDQMEIGSGRK